ncbi:unnamed protein product [Owenia fusiformis]|nr:unnamed protein product [Owenia fusiformis]
MLQKLRNMGKRIFFITNNSSRSNRQFVAKLNKLGFPAEEAEAVSTSWVAAWYLKEQNFKGKVYLVGNTGMAEELDNAGIKYTGLGPDVAEEESIWDTVDNSHQIFPIDPEVQCVLVGFDQHISFPKLLKAASYLKNEKVLFLATNEDPRLPLKNAPITMPGTGCIVSPVRIASGREPLVLGKPNTPMFDSIHEKYHIDPAKTLMVGDSLKTDILMGNKCGLKSLLVLTGINSLEDAKSVMNSSSPDVQQQAPDFYIEDIGQFGQFL